MLLLFSSTARADFGVQPEPADPSQPDFHVNVLNSDGLTPYTRAGGHPFEMTTSFNLNLGSDGFPDGRLKDAQVDIPAGLVGDPTATPTCEYNDLSDSGNCPIQAQVGITAVRIVVELGVVELWTPVYNMPPAPGDVATFAFNVLNVLTPVHVRIRSDGDYGVRAVVHNPSTYLPLAGSTLTLWGVPADPSHDGLRGSCLNFDGSSNGSCPSQASPRPFLTNPADCSAGPQATALKIDSYEAPTDIKTYTSTPSPAVTGCDKLSFDAGLTLRPASTQAGAPTGVTVHLHLLQNDNAVGVGTPPLRDAKVTLPSGVAISPSSADGLGACTDDQLGVHSLEAATCPSSSRIGTMRVDTPVLPVPLLGRIYLGQPLPGQMFRIFLEAYGQGTRVKLVGDVNPDPLTGQITTTFRDNPQLPFNDLELTFDGGPHAALANPRSCGTYTTTSQLMPWSTPTTPTVTTSDSFDVTTGLDGGVCGAVAFAPGLVAGTQNPQAGAFSPFVLRLTRSDSDQELASIPSVMLPPGLLADVGSISPLCTNAQAASASCSASSRIGGLVVGAGAGADPFYVNDGAVYLTGPYKGAPYGLAFVVHALAGPFDLGMVVVRAALNIDPHTAQVTVNSDPFPTTLQGIPLQLRDIRVNIDRSHFTLNPTNCSPMSVAGTVTSTEGQSATVSNRFQVGECRSLPFHPGFKASSNAKTSRKNGASFHVVVQSSEGQANIAKVDVQVPTAFAVRDSTLNQACTEAQFAGNPAACPPGSFVGSATARTPILASPLVGSAIFVSHGGAAFPDLDLVLQGEGITIVLTGKTFVKNGRLLSRFDTVPDAPISRFDLVLPTGPHSALAANGSLCDHKTNRLVMPTTITGQNGAVIHQSTKVSVSGCPKTKKSRKSSRTHKKR